MKDNPRQFLLYVWFEWCNWISWFPTSPHAVCRGRMQISPLYTGCARILRLSRSLPDPMARRFSAIMPFSSQKQHNLISWGSSKWLGPQTKVWLFLDQKTRPKGLWLGGGNYKGDAIRVRTLQNTIVDQRSTLWPKPGSSLSVAAENSRSEIETESERTTLQKFLSEKFFSEHLSQVLERLAVFAHDRRLET